MKDRHLAEFRAQKTRLYLPRGMSALETGRIGLRRLLSGDWESSEAKRRLQLKGRPGGVSTALAYLCSKQANSKS